MPGPSVLLIVPFWYPKSLLLFCGQGFPGFLGKLPWWGELAAGQYPCPCLAQGSAAQPPRKGGYVFH